jgi:hypothetical protein
MTNLTRASVVLAGMAMTWGACGGSKLGGTGTGGAGGTGVGGFGGFETGGFPSPSGGSGWGGTTGDGGFATGGSIGTGGEFVWTGGSGWGGTIGTGGSSSGPFFPDGGTCSAPTMGPLSTSDAPRPFGWTLRGAPADAGSAGVTGVAGNAGADGGTSPALCRTVPAAYPGTACTGIASLQSTASGPVIVFGDGSELVWDGTLPSVLEPYVRQASGGGDVVWVDYEKKITVVCPFCGAYTTQTLQIREGQSSGKVRFYDQQGAVLPNLTNVQVTDIFGVTATATPSCTFPAYAGCYSYLRSEFDQHLATSPPQTILDATLTEVTAPNGTFQVIWASSAESYAQREPTCAEGPDVASDTGFVAALVSP